MPYIDLGSVVGPQGEQGATGAQGIRGEQGLPGPNQVTNSTATPLTGVLTGNGSVVGVTSVDSAPTDESTNLVSSGGVKTALDAKANPSQIANVETGATASRAYAVNECFCMGGLMYRVTQPIAEGGTITPGTNCTQTTAATKPGMRLLWENPNTGNAFAETTCAGTGGFGTYIIVCRVSNTAQSYVSFVVSCFVIGEPQVITNVTSPASSLPVVSFRSITKQDTGLLTISNCDSRTVTSTSRTQTNTDLIPARIYGVY